MMATLHFPFPGSASFGPEEIRTMAAAIDAAWQSLVHCRHGKRWRA
jgi:hypothetical protein